MNAATIFAWENARRWPVVLPGFILLSLVAHAGTFFLFQIAYPERVTIAPPVPTVSLLDPRRPDHQALLRLIESEDPAPVAAAQAVVPRHLLEVPYRPSYATVRTLPQTLPEPVVPAQFPPPRDPLVMIRGAVPAPPVSAPASAPIATRLAFSGVLGQRSLTRDEPIKFRTLTAAPLASASFLVGVTDAGEVRFVFLQSSSGDPAMDEAAATHLNRLSFSKVEIPIAWGHATFAWGDDVYAAGDPNSK